MHVAGKNAVAVVEHGVVPLVMHALRKHDTPVEHGEDRSSDLAAQVDAVMADGAAAKRLALLLLNRIRNLHAAHEDRRGNVVHVTRMRNRKSDAIRRSRREGRRLDASFCGDLAFKFCLSFLTTTLLFGCKLPALAAMHAT